MTRPGYTHIETVIDRSGSMESIRADMQGGYNRFIADQRVQPGYATVGLSEFDTTHDFVYTLTPIHAVKDYVLIPRGATALVDALCRSVDRLGRDLFSKPESERPEHVIFVIVTDGGENASREFTRADVRSRIEKQQSQYNWTFVFMGANQDSFAEAKTYGIPQWSTINYRANEVGTGAVYASLSNNVSGLRSMKGGTPVASFFSDSDRLAAEAADPTITSKTKKS